jgi:hypothetical protein
MHWCARSSHGAPRPNTSCPISSSADALTSSVRQRGSPRNIRRNFRSPPTAVLQDVRIAAARSTMSAVTGMRHLRSLADGRIPDIAQPGRRSDCRLVGHG